MSSKPSKKPRGKIAVKGTIPAMELSMPLDAAKIKAIQACLAKGELRIKVTKVDFAAGKIGEAWLYD